PARAAAARRSDHRTTLQRQQRTLLGRRLQPGANAEERSRAAQSKGTVEGGDMRSGRRTVTTGLAALLLIVPTICAADYDMTGLWRAAINGGGDAIFTITQTGTALQIQGQPPNDDVVGTGTIDPMTGVLSIQFSIVSPPTCGALFDGQLTPNGKALIAPGSIVSTSPDCHSLMCICE